MLHKRRIVTVLLGLGLANGLCAAAREEKSIRDLEDFPNFEAPIVEHAKADGYELNFEKKGLTNLDGLGEINIKLENVTTLKFGENEILNIPEGTFSAFGNLRYLYLGRNQLMHIPGALAVLSNLQVLNLSQNQIVAVETYPLEKLKRLESLFLYCNYIEYVDPTLVSILASKGSCTYYRYITLSRNCINKEHEKELLQAFMAGRKDSSVKLCLQNQQERPGIQDRNRNTKSAKT